jgi:hypothetical protein
LKRAFSLARIAGDIVYQPHIQLLDESDNVRQGFVNPAEFVKLHDNLPSYLKPIIEFSLSHWNEERSSKETGAQAH